MAIRVHLQGGHFDGQYHEIDVDPHQGFVKVCVTVRDRQNVRKTAH